MSTGQGNQTNWTEDSSELASRFPGRANVAPSGDSEAAFASQYTEALGVARDLLANDDYGGAHPASKPIPGKADAAGEETWQNLLLGYSRLTALGSGDGERQFDDQDNQPEPPRDRGGMGRLKSQAGTAQFESVPETSLAVFDKTAQHPSGHIEVYDGKRWVSDFMQPGFSPYRDAASTPPFTIYRLT